METFKCIERPRILDGIIWDGVSKAEFEAWLHEFELSNFRRYEELPDGTFKAIFVTDTGSFSVVKGDHLVRTETSQFDTELMVGTKAEFDARYVIQEL